MNCIYCGEKTEVVDTRKKETRVKRRRRCASCGLFFETSEISLENGLDVIISVYDLAWIINSLPFTPPPYIEDGQERKWFLDRQKILTDIGRAIFDVRIKQIIIERK